MQATVKSLGIDRLSLDERVLLAQEIWDGIAAEIEAGDIPQWHKDELNRRLEAHEADPSRGLSWEEVKARLGMPRGESP